MTDQHDGEATRLVRVAGAAIDYAVRHRVPRAVPSDVLGNGIALAPIDALALVELWKARAGDALARRVADRLHREQWFDAADTARIETEAQRAATRATDVLMPMFERFGLVERI